MAKWMSWTGLFALLCCCFFTEVKGELAWQTNYQSALSQAKSSGKPIVLFFTGSDWCGWCKKLEQEALNTPEFKQLAGDKFIFVLLDFPMNKPSDPTLVEQNKQLQQRYNIKGYPTLIILDKDGQQIGSTGYRAGGARAYAEHLLKIVQDYNQYHQKVSQLDKKKLSGPELKELYLKASELNREDDQRSLALLGVKNMENHFFLIERLKLLSKEGKIHDAEAIALKNEILSLDPNNEKRLQYELAVIEFDAYSEEMNRDSYAPEIAVEPLVNYIEKFGKKDSEHLWKLQMTI
ncbi:MAG: thioredoxin family protein, partial [Parachlamydiaceae bacterium]